MRLVPLRPGLLHLVERAGEVLLPARLAPFPRRASARAGRRAKVEASPDLDGFTFDHTLDGVVAVSCSETEEFWLVVAQDNDIEEVLLARGDCQEGFWPRLPGARPMDPLAPATSTDGVVRRRIEGVRYAVRERPA